MLLFTILTAVLSAFLDNVTTVLLVGRWRLLLPVFSVSIRCRSCWRRSSASNIGGTATLIGDPPNIMIGSQAGLSFMDFVMNTGVAVIFIMIALCLSFYFVFGRKLVVAPEKMEAVMQLDENKSIKDHGCWLKAWL